MTSDYIGKGFTKSAKDRAKDYLESLGLNPTILDMVPSKVVTPEQMAKMQPGAAAFYDPGSKSVTFDTESANSPHVWLHEYMHALQASLSDQDNEELVSLMLANPPEGQGGFTNYPKGAPTAHHNLQEGYGLASYMDYNYYTQIGTKPAAEQFRTTVPPVTKETYMLNAGSGPGMPATVKQFESQDQPPWWNMPKPVLDFLKKRFPRSDLYIEPTTKSQPWKQLGE